MEPLFLLHLVTKSLPRASEVSLLFTQLGEGSGIEGGQIGWGTGCGGGLTDKSHFWRWDLTSDVWGYKRCGCSYGKICWPGNDILPDGHCIRLLPKEVPGPGLVSVAGSYTGAMASPAQDYPWSLLHRFPSK